LHVSMKNLFGSGAVALGQIIVKAHCGTKPVELRGFKTALSH
jgi:hypothetical protein